MNNTENNKLYLMNIFILDWDDTLFPTSWIKKNNIKDYDNYNLYFLELDKTITLLLEKLYKIGSIYIVSNATTTWIKKGLKKLPFTQNFIENNGIEIISARDIYSNKNVTPNEWKTNIFEDLVDININMYKNNDKNTYFNIISLGDADFEYVALIKLHKYLNNMNCDNYFLKNIRFIENPNFNSVIEQIDLVSYNINNISQKLCYIDLNILSI